jgi:hypothetical protein
VAINLAGMSSIRFQNMLMQKRNYLYGVVMAIEEEPIEHHINQIILLTEPKDI